MRIRNGESHRVYSRALRGNLTKLGILGFDGIRHSMNIGHSNEEVLERKLISLIAIGLTNLKLRVQRICDDRVKIGGLIQYPIVYLSRQELS